MKMKFHKPAQFVYISLLCSYMIMLFLHNSSPLGTEEEEGERWVVSPRPGTLAASDGVEISQDMSRCWAILPSS